VLFGGCIVEAPQGTPGATRAGVKVPPVLNLRLGARFDDKLEVTGAQVTPGALAPGGQVRVTLFIQVHETVPRDYAVFVHAEPDRRNERMLFDHDPADGYATSRWKKGEQIRDEFVVTLPATTTASFVSLWFGFWDRASDERMPLKNPDAVRHDGNNRVFLGRIPVAQ
jgi:hypothetical protein